MYVAGMLQKDGRLKDLEAYGLTKKEMDRPIDGEKDNEMRRQRNGKKRKVEEPLA